MPRRGGGNRIAKFPQNPLILPEGAGRSGNDAQPDHKCLELSPPNPSAWEWSAVGSWKLTRVGQGVVIRLGGGQQSHYTKRDGQGK
jgi:hypothetical protein